VLFPAPLQAAVAVVRIQAVPRHDQGQEERPQEEVAPLSGDHGAGVCQGRRRRRRGLVSGEWFS
jgi:hypothetical protein